MIFGKIKTHYANLYKKLSIGVSAIFALPASRKLEKQFDGLIDDTPSEYDKHIDKIFNETGIGGGYHRHFDESHSPLKMLEKVRETFKEDTLSDEVKNYVISLLKDLQTINGIPLFNISDKQKFDDIANYINSTFGIKKSWIMDIMSVNMAEVFMATVGALALIYNWSDKEKLEFKSEIASSMVLSSLIAANPLLLIVSVISLGTTYTQKKAKKEMNKGTVTGLASTGSFLITANLFASPLIGVIFGFAVAIAIRKNIKKYKTEDILPEIRKLTKKHEELIKGAAIGAAFVAITGI